MFWILRHTRAANFFNALNNNYNLKTNNNNNNDKNAKRPPRKAYGRLSVDSDDACSIKKIDNPYDNDDDDNYENYDIVNSKDQANNDIQGNYTNDDSDVELHEKSKNSTQQKELNENTISRLQAIAMSEDEDYDESLTCNVCDRAFHCHRQLASHQQKKRHFGCSGCDSLFPSLMLLEHHKEEFEHWSDDEDNRRPCCRRNRGDDFTDTDSITSEAESEDLERLL